MVKWHAMNLDMSVGKTETEATGTAEVRYIRTVCSYQHAEESS